MTGLSFGSHAPARRVILHLSDTHLLGGGRRLGDHFDVVRNLTAAIARIRTLDPRPDAIVVTGDLTDLGEPEAYVTLRELLTPLAADLGSELVWVAGNHDERPALREHLLGGSPTQDPVTRVVDLNGLRLIALDSSVPGWHHGDIDAAQLDWLREQLAEPAPLGTLLALHHPPLPSHIPFFDILELQHQDELAAVLRGSDVRAILAGHLHYATFGTFAGIPVSVAAATCYTMDLARPTEEINGMDAGQSFHLVHVWDDTITHAVVPVAAAETVPSFTPEWYRTMAALTPEERLERFSRKPTA
ncbi:phosphodiesterase [Microbacterium gorillae]|uniref:phosphodiesterase n=1 Tax=Microbacterium gorillae TaxID=1231063 RepID=UPI000B21F2BC|nr:phosphodiesterase [Microbacterium gorillae]